MQSETAKMKMIFYVHVQRIFNIKSKELSFIQFYIAVFSHSLNNNLTAIFRFRLLKKLNIDLMLT